MRAATLIIGAPHCEPSSTICRHRGHARIAAVFRCQPFNVAPRNRAPTPGLNRSTRSKLWSRHPAKPRVAALPRSSNPSRSVSRFCATYLRRVSADIGRLRQEPSLHFRCIFSLERRDCHERGAPRISLPQGKVSTTGVQVVSILPDPYVNTATGILCLREWDKYRLYLSRGWVSWVALTGRRQKCQGIIVIKPANFGSMTRKLPNLPNYPMPPKR
jgi:hypothetical protein